VHISRLLQVQSMAEILSGCLLSHVGQRGGLEKYLTHVGQQLSSDSLELCCIVLCASAVTYNVATSYLFDVEVGMN
jgi:hypothetical protein